MFNIRKLFNFKKQNTEPKLELHPAIIELGKYFEKNGGEGKIRFENSFRYESKPVRLLDYYQIDLLPEEFYFLKEKVENYEKKEREKELEIQRKELLKILKKI